jgi:hypothetical protein
MGVEPTRAIYPQPKQRRPKVAFLKMLEEVGDFLPRFFGVIYGDVVASAALRSE